MTEDLLSKLEGSRATAAPVTADARRTRHADSLDRVRARHSSPQVHRDRGRRGADLPPRAGGGASASVGRGARGGPAPRRATAGHAGRGPRRGGGCADDPVGCRVARAARRRPGLARRTVLHLAGGGRARARHCRQHRHLQRDRRRDAATTAVRRTRGAGPGLVEERRAPESRFFRCRLPTSRRGGHGRRPRCSSPPTTGRGWWRRRTAWRIRLPSSVCPRT